MKDPPRSRAVINDFPGQVTNADPRDLPAGAAEEQTNAVSDTIGELRVRLGMRPVTFEED